jgi:hypothetical protein
MLSEELANAPSFAEKGVKTALGKQANGFNTN